MKKTLKILTFIGAVVTIGLSTLSAINFNHHVIQKSEDFTSDVNRLVSNSQNFYAKPDVLFSTQLGQYIVPSSNASLIHPTTNYYKNRNNDYYSLNANFGFNCAYKETVYSPNTVSEKVALPFNDLFTNSNLANNYNLIANNFSNVTFEDTLNRDNVGSARTGLTGSFAADKDTFYDYYRLFDMMYFKLNQYYYFIASAAEREVQTNPINNVFMIGELPVASIDSSNASTIFNALEDNLSLKAQQSFVDSITSTPYDDLNTFSEKQLSQDSSDDEVLPWSAFYEVKSEATVASSQNHYQQFYNSLQGFKVNDANESTKMERTYNTDVYSISLESIYQNYQRPIVLQAPTYISDSSSIQTFQNYVINFNKQDTSQLNLVNTEGFKTTTDFSLALENPSIFNFNAGNAFNYPITSDAGFSLLVLFWVLLGLLVILILIFIVLLIYYNNINLLEILNRKKSRI